MQSNSEARAEYIQGRRNTHITLVARERTRIELEVLPLLRAPRVRADVRVHLRLLPLVQRPRQEQTGAAAAAGVEELQRVAQHCIAGKEQYIEHGF